MKGDRPVTCLYQREAHQCDADHVCAFPVVVDDTQAAILDTLRHILAKLEGNSQPAPPPDWKACLISWPHGIAECRHDRQPSPPGPPAWIKDGVRAMFFGTAVIVINQPLYMRWRKWQAQVLREDGCTQWVPCADLVPLEEGE